MAEWTDGNILETEFISHSGPNAYEIHFRTPDRTKYLFVESACRDAISRDIHRCAECTNILQLRGHDVRPVVRASWENETDFIFVDLSQQVRCPKCGSFAYFYDKMPRNFCPNCGADMREAKKDG